MLAWLRDLTSRERRTMLACWGGWTLDGFDQQLYSYVAPTVIAVWGMSTGAAGTIGTITVRPRSRWAEQSPGGLLMPNQSLLYTGRVLASSQLNPMMRVCRELCGGQICVTPISWRSRTRKPHRGSKSTTRSTKIGVRRTGRAGSPSRDPLNSNYAGHRLTFRLFAQSPPFAHLTTVYRKFRLGRTAPLRPQVRWPFGPGARRHRSAAVAHNRRVA